MGVNQKILDAIELLTNNSIKKAGYDKTIQAQIISCEDATIGKYKCRYQDTTFFAYVQFFLHICSKNDDLWLYPRKF